MFKKGDKVMSIDGSSVGVILRESEPQGNYNTFVVSWERGALKGSCHIRTHLWTDLIKLEWQVVQKGHVRQMWARTCDCETTQDNPQFRLIEPSFFAEAGFPTCTCCDSQFEYQHTEILDGVTNDGKSNSLVMFTDKALDSYYAEGQHQNVGEG